MKSELESWLSNVTVENNEVVKSAHEEIDGVPQKEKTSQTSVETASKPKCAS